MKKIALIILLMIGFNYNILFTQIQGQVKIDSLLKELPKAKEDTNKVNLLNILAFEFYGINPDEGIKYGEQSYLLAKKINWKNGIANAANALGVCYWAKSNYSESLEFYFKALKIFEEIGNKKGIANNFGNIGIIFLNQSDYSRALEYYLKALRINEDIGNKVGIANNFANIGGIYHNQLNFNKALEYYFKSLKMQRELGNKSGVARNLGNIGLVYSNKSDNRRALEYFFKALKLEEELGNKSGIANNLVSIGSVYNQTDYPMALEYYFKALKMFEELGNKRGIALNLGNIGGLYLRLSHDSIFANFREKNKLVGRSLETNFKLGINYSNKAISISQVIGDLAGLINWYRNLYEGYKHIGNFPKALEFLELFKSLQDSVFNQENVKKFATLEASRETQLRKKEIELLRVKQEKQKAVISKRDWQLFGSLFALLLLIIFSFFVIRERRKSEQLLLNILPEKIAHRLKKGETPIADHFEEASVIFIDIADFTKLSARSKPQEMVKMLNDIFTIFDKISAKYGLEKIKTIGDCYMAAAGIPIPRKDHAEAVAKMAVEVMETMRGYRVSGIGYRVSGIGDGASDTQNPKPEIQRIEFRIGLDCGPIVAGVIGEQKFIYDLWGDMVNTASRMETHGIIGRIQCTSRFRDKLVDSRQSTVVSEFKFEERGEIDIKGKGMMKTYFLVNG